MRSLLAVFILSMTLGFNALADQTPSLESTHVEWGSFKTDFVVMAKAATWDEANTNCDKVAPGHAWHLPTVAELKGVLSAGSLPFQAVSSKGDDIQTYVSWVNQSEAAFSGNDRLCAVSNVSDKSSPVEMSQLTKTHHVDNDGVPTVCLNTKTP